MGAVSIALFEDKIYWTNPSHGVYSANKFTGRDVQEELSEILSIASLIIMHPMLQNEEIKGILFIQLHVLWNHLSLRGPIMILINCGFFL